MKKKKKRQKPSQFGSRWTCLFGDKATDPTQPVGLGRRVRVCWWGPLASCILLKVVETAVASIYINLNSLIMRFVWNHRRDPACNSLEDRSISNLPPQKNYPPPLLPSTTTTASLGEPLASPRFRALCLRHW